MGVFCRVLVEGSGRMLVDFELEFCTYGCRDNDINENNFRDQCWRVKRDRACVCKSCVRKSLSTACEVILPSPLRAFLVLNATLLPRGSNESRDWGESEVGEDDTDRQQEKRRGICVLAEVKSLDQVLIKSLVEHLGRVSHRRSKAVSMSGVPRLLAARSGRVMESGHVAGCWLVEKRVDIEMQEQIRDSRKRGRKGT